MPSSLPYRLLDGTTVANNWSDLVDGTLAHPIDIDETGASRVVAGGTQVWTGTDIAGGAFWGLSCSVWTNATSSGDQAFAGINNTTDLNWTMNQVLTCDQKSLHLYCLEQGAAPSNPAPPSTCPSRIDFSSPVSSVVWGGSSGTTHLRPCPSGQVAIGYTVYERKSPAPDVLAGLAAVCGTISVVQGSCQVAISAGTTFPLDGGMGSAGPFNRMCPPNQMVVGVQGHVGIYDDQLGFGCAPLTLSKVGSSYTATVGAITWLPVDGGSGGGTAVMAPCPAGQVVMGSDIHSSTLLNAYGALCATPVLFP